MDLEHISIHFMNQSWEFWVIQPRRERRDHKANRPNNRSQCLKPNAIPIQLFLSANQSRAGTRSIPPREHWQQRARISPSPQYAELEDRRFRMGRETVRCVAQLR